MAAAETVLTPDGWAFSHFFEGPYLASTERALRQAEALQHALPAAPAVRARAVHADAVAARRRATRTPPPAQPAPTDLLVPLAPAPPGIAAHRPHRVAELLPVLTPAARPPPLLGSPA